MDDDFFFPETVSVESQSGSVTKNLRAQIERSNKILLCGDQVVIEVDDVIVHVLGNGAIHRYSVQDVQYQRGDLDLPAITTLEVRKEGSKSSRDFGGQYISVSGANARVNLHSNDYSVNNVKLLDNPIFKSLENALQGLPDDDPQKQALLKSALSLASAPPSTPAFTEKFQEFMGLAATCTKVVAPFLPEIVKLLGH